MPWAPSSMYSVIMGRLGEDLVAANSIMASLRSVATVLGFGVANGTAILLGKAIGAGDMARAERDAKRLLGLTFLASLLGSAVVLAAYPIITHTMTTLSEQALSYFGIMTAISVVYVWGPPMNTCWMCGVFRAGGDSKFGFILDVICMWVVMVPLGLLSAFVLKLPPMWVYFILSLDETIKMPANIIHYRKKGWLRNITRDKIT